MRALRKDQRRAVNLTGDPIRGVIAVYLIICNRALFEEPLCNQHSPLSKTFDMFHSSNPTPPHMTGHSPQKHLCSAAALLLV